MKKFLLPILTLFVFSFLACITDNYNPFDANLPCNDDLTALDTIYLEPESIEFLPYTGNESFYFKNNEGKEVKFVPLYPPLSHRFYETEFTLICRWGSKNEYSFVREQYAVSHKCEQLDLRYYLNIYSYHSEWYPEFFDKLVLLFHKPPPQTYITTRISLDLVSSYKGNKNLLGDELAAYSNYTFEDESTILNKTFSDVYKVHNPDETLKELYFNKALGIIGFRDLDGILWVFDRFE